MRLTADLLTKDTAAINIREIIINTITTQAITTKVHRTLGVTRLTQGSAKIVMHHHIPATLLINRQIMVITMPTITKHHRLDIQLRLLHSNIEFSI